MSIYIRLPSFRKVEIENEKPYTVFLVEVNVAGRVLVTEKRYSEFEELHKKLKRTITTPHLPPKSVLKWNHKVLEHRRQGLEAYLQGVIDGGRIPRSLMKFLEMQHVPTPDNNSASMESLDNLDNADSQMLHQPVMAFTEAAFSQDQTRSYLPDIVTQGVVQGLYGSADDLR